MIGLDSAVARQATAEFVGTAFLVATVVGSGIMATELTDDGGLQLLANSLATGAVLVALILTLQPVSAAFNPVITLAELATRSVTRTAAVAAAALIAAQVAGGIVGAVVANLMFDLDAVSWSETDRSCGHLWLGEVVATLGLVLVVLLMSRSGRSESIAYAVGGYITAAYWFTSSTSFANPAVTVGRIFSDTFAGIEPASAPTFVLMQLVGGALGIGLVLALTSVSIEDES